MHKKPRRDLSKQFLYIFELVGFWNSTSSDYLPKIDNFIFFKYKCFSCVKRWN